MKKIQRIDLSEIRTIFSSSTAKSKFLVVLLTVLIISSSVMIFGIYVPFIWIIMFILLDSYEDNLFQFIIIDYQFLIPPLMTYPRKPSHTNELLNGFILMDMSYSHPDIVFKVNERTDRSAMKTSVLDGVKYIEIDNLAMKVFSQKEFQAIIYHELGHIALKHIDESKILVFLGYLVFIFLPILLPLFWLIGSYICRYQELAADKYSLKHDPNHFILKAEEGVKLEKMRVNFWHNLWYNFLYITVAPNPSLNMKINSLRRVKTF